MSQEITARARANIALVKYWGKRDAALNLPAQGSLSLTLDALRTTTTVRFGADLPGDQFVLDGRETTGRALAQLSSWLDIVRAHAGINTRARVVSDNDFPTAAGLASSASAYAALALAASRAAGLTLDPRALSVLARRGSGSAARSIYGGFVRMYRGERDDGSDAYAEPVTASVDSIDSVDPVNTAANTAADTADTAAWDVRMVIAIVGSGGRKQHLSRDAMEHCARTSPLYPGWLASVPDDLHGAECAIHARNIIALGEVTEASALCMHAAAIASRPGIVYWQPGTLACMSAVRALRADGVHAYYTMDAGPHVKVLSTPEHADIVAQAMARVADVSRTMISAPGPGVELVSSQVPGRQVPNRPRAQPKRT